ncbi:MAG TPA: CBS domain-containing protein [Polyangiaceae bacterium]|nr:CBS domain-containing protein [Polyangiaceae bacterium]
MAQQRTPPQQRNSSLPRPPESAPGANPSKVSGAAKPPEASSKSSGASAPKPTETSSKPPEASGKPPEASGKPQGAVSGKAPEASRKPSGSGTSNLKDVLDELGAASEAARLQLHLLALEARQRTGELSARLENVERGLDRGFHQALATAAERARQLSKTLQASFAGGAPQKSAQIRVGAVMTDDVQVCSPEDPLYRPAQAMWEGDCGCVPVVDASGRVCGVITDRDICMAAYTKGLPLNSIRVAEVMSRHVHACNPEDTLERAIGMMADAEVRRLLVVAEDGKLRGIVSLADVAHGAALLGHHEAEAIVFRLLGALSKPRASAKHQILAAE